MIDFLNWPNLSGLPRVIHLILAAVVVLAGRATIRDYLKRRRIY